jgi:hypothetical protein
MKFKRFKMVKICLMIIIKFFARKFFVLSQSAQHFSGKRQGSGSALVTNGSGCRSGRPKTIRILRSLIRNTVYGNTLLSFYVKYNYCFATFDDERRTVLIRGGHRHLQIGRMLDIDLISEPPKPLPPDVCFRSVARGAGSDS